MTDKADTAVRRRWQDELVRLSPHLLTIGAVLLGWQIAIQPLQQRAPVEFAIKLAPGSPGVLGRAAESELAAGRASNAGFLSREALKRSPFDVRAMRVTGLTEASAGRIAEADEILTLAGNWSLRDDPTHAWLIENRLRRGDYASAFAHADTLVRRRDDVRPQVFRLFTAAALQDPQRVIPVLASLLAANPPWRLDYVYSLDDTLDGLRVGAALALVLQSGGAPLTNAELQQFYNGLLNAGQVDAVKTLRTRLNRPASNALVSGGGFDGPPAPEPFQWTLAQKAGAAASIENDDVGSHGPALRSEYDGYSSAVLASQRIFLSQGRYRFSIDMRTEAGTPADRLAWTIRCVGDNRVILSLPVSRVAAENRAWKTTNAEFSTPSGCASQSLELRGRPLDYRAPMVVWFDDAAIEAFSATQPR